MLTDPEWNAIRENVLTTALRKIFDAFKVTPRVLGDVIVSSENAMRDKDSRQLYFRWQGAIKAEIPALKFRLLATAAEKGRQLAEQCIEDLMREPMLLKKGDEIFLLPDPKKPAVSMRVPAPKGPEAGQMTILCELILSVPHPTFGGMEIVEESTRIKGMMGE